MEAFQQKVLKHISSEGLIFFSKFNDFYSNEKLSYQTVNLLYEVFTNSKQQPSTSILYTKNFYTVCLYYLTEYDRRFSKIFYDHFKPGVNININSTNEVDLILIYNIIEYDDKYHIYNTEEKTQLSVILDSFNSTQKKFEFFLLFYYYNSIIHLQIKSIRDSIQINYDLIDVIQDHQQKNAMTALTKFIQLKNRILSTRILKSSEDMSVLELSIVYKDVLDEVGKIDTKVALKLRIKLFDLYKELNQYSNCWTVIKETYEGLKLELFKGNKLDYCIEFILNVLIRMAYICVLNNESSTLMNTLKKTQKYIEMIKSDQNKDMKSAYEAYLLFYQQNLEYTGVTGNSKNYAILDYFRGKYNELIENPDDAHVNLFAMNSTDKSFNLYIKLYKESIKSLEQKEKIPENYLMRLIMSIYNYISNEVKVFINDPSEQQRAQRIKNIYHNSEALLEYIDTFYQQYPILQVNFLKEVIVKIAFEFISVFYLKKDYNEVLSQIYLFDMKIKKYWNQTGEAIVAYGYILKLKGDAYLKMEKYQEAKECYLKSLSSKRSDKDCAIIKANLGICYVLLKDPKKGSEYLNLSLIDYGNLFKINNIPIYQEKYNLINSLISQLNFN